MNFNNTFSKAMKKQLDKGRRAIFSKLIKAGNFDLPIDIQTQLFESIAYMSQRFGNFPKNGMLEIFLNKILKHLKLH